MSNIIKIVAILRARPGQGDAVKEALLGCMQDSRKEPGCVFYDLHVDQNEPLQFVFIEGWKDHAAIEFHKTTAHYQAMILAVGERLDHREVLVLVLDEV